MTDTQVPKTWTQFGRGKSLEEEVNVGDRISLNFASSQFPVVYGGKTVDGTHTFLLPFAQGNGSSRAHNRIMEIRARECSTTPLGFVDFKSIGAIRYLVGDDGYESRQAMIAAHDWGIE